MPSREQTYAAAGVSLATADAVVGRLRAAVESTATAGVVGAFGAFAGLFAIDDRRLLAASTDSVGSKLVLGRRGDRLRWCGEDLAAHCINDILTTGAEPLFFLDYVAANRVDIEQVAELIEGAADVCRAAGCAILGGETAELPGIYREDEIDFCGTAVGVVDRDRVVDGSRIAPETWCSASRRPGSTRTASRSSAASSATTRSTPTCSCRRRGSTSTTSGRSGPRRRSGLAHVTGGGIAGNLARVLPDGLGAVVDPSCWERPEVFAWLAANGVAEDELRRVFNIGIGYCAVIPPADVRAGDLVIGRDRAGRRGRGLGGHDRRPRQRRGDEPAGADRCGPADRRRRVELARAPALSGRETASVPTAAFPIDGFADRDERDAAMADWLDARGVAARRAARATCTCCGRSSSPASRVGSSTCTRRCCPPFPVPTPSRTRSRPVSPRRGRRSTGRRGDRHRRGVCARSACPCSPATRPTPCTPAIRRRRASPAARGREGADRRHEARTALGVRQDRGRGVRARSCASSTSSCWRAAAPPTLLAEEGIPVTRLEELTGFAEMLGHRVVTLHPAVHGGILARRDVPEDVADLDAHGIEPIDLVCVNLYPFEQTVGRLDVEWDEAIEKIDVGGPALLRARCEEPRPRDPGLPAGGLRHACSASCGDGDVSVETRRSLAARAFTRTASYDSAVARLALPRATAFRRRSCRCSTSRRRSRTARTRISARSSTPSAVRARICSRASSSSTASRSRSTTSTTSPPPACSRSSSTGRPA